MSCLKCCLDLDGLLLLKFVTTFVLSYLELPHSWPQADRAFRIRIANDIRRKCGHITLLTNMQDFRRESTSGVLLCTDMAGRGLDGLAPAGQVTYPVSSPSCLSAAAASPPPVTPPPSPRLTGQLCHLPAAKPASSRTWRPPGYCFRR